ncbi:MAG: hypothetical protein OEY41_18040 [Acidimicrobiia bacterium]|nr:hypothetical protein [Acidimicrobiia bacterium]
MERNEISAHEVEVYRVLATNGHRWLSNREIHELANGVAPRTVRHLTKKLVGLGIVDQAEVFPGHRFRISAHARQRNRGYLDRLHGVASILGADLQPGENQ